MGFAIGVAERDAWYRHMAAAVKDGDVADDVETTLLTYFAAAATQLTHNPSSHTV